MPEQHRRPLDLAALILALAAPVPGWTGQGIPSATLDDPALPQLVRALACGERMIIEGVNLEIGGAAETLELERFRVFSPEARVEVHGDVGTQTLRPPANAYLRGTVAGRRDASAAVTVLADGAIRGLVSDGGRSWMLSRPPGEARARVAEITDHPAVARANRAFECATDLLPQSPGGRPDSPIVPPGDPEGADFGRVGGYTARVAIETDFEYFHLFAGIDEAVSYAGDLFAYASATYADEVGTDFLIQSISLWTTAADPWTETSSLCGLAEFGQYWNDHHPALERTLAHFLSGKSAGGGIAWVGVLCSERFTVDISSWGCSLTPAVDTYGGDYGFSGNISGSFSPVNPAVVWDIYVVSHEVGHNFGSPHTHCYNPPVDECYGSEPGCYSGPTALPCSTPGAGCGTIMSYCHLLSPGLSNISLTFGLDHPWGTAPERVPALMSSYVAATAVSDPSCLSSIVFADGFESGDASAWTD